MNKRIPRAKFKMGRIALKLHNFFKSREVFIDGGAMIRRSQKSAMLGHEFMKFLIEHQDHIPETWDNYDLVFPGAKQKIEGEDCVAYLRKTRGLWRAGFGRVSFDWDRRACIVRIC